MRKKSDEPMLAASAGPRTVDRGVHEGVFPVLPTFFNDGGELDLGSHDRGVDYLIDAQVDGICVLANWSEQFSLSDEERKEVVSRVLHHVAGRVPVIVTASHFSTRIAVERSRWSEAAGATMLMLMPPYHGSTVVADEQGIFEFFQAVDAAVTVPIIVQDAPMSGVQLSVTLLGRLARELGNVQYAKIEVPRTAAKVDELVRSLGPDLPGIWDGEEGITLLADLDAGAVGTMPSATIPDLLRLIVDAHRDGRREEALALYERALPLLSYENRQTGLAAAKVLMKAGGIITSDAVRHPLRPLSESSKGGLIEHARRLNPLILNWNNR